MLPAVFLVFALAVTAAVMALVWSSLKKDISRVFTEDDKTLRQAHPYPLHTFRFVSGGLRAQTVLPFRFRGRRIRFPNTLRFRAALRLDVYSDMLVVSAMGRALRLPYARHAFKYERSGIFGSLSVDNLPVREKTAPEFFPNPVDLDKTTSLTLHLGQRRINRIAALAKRARGEPGRLPIHTTY